MKTQKENKMNYYKEVKKAIAAIEHVLTSQNLGKEVRAEFEANKKNLEKLLRFL
jgi:hypothetical protein